MPTANDKAWERYITARNLQLDGMTYRITARDLKTAAKREPRLMTKFDTPRQLPRILRESGYAVMPVKNGEYLLFQGDIFTPLVKCSTQDAFKSQIAFPLATVGRGTGEAEYLDNAFNSGLTAEFTQSGLLYLTIRGKERTRSFSFKIESSNLSVDVDGVQIEIDAGYESEHDIILIEAKIGSPSHFNIRQLYYPFCHFSIIAPQKRIRTLFFEYDLSAATYTFYEFVFDDPEIFDSIRQARCCVYSLVPRRPHKIDELLDARFETTSDIVPQADDLNKVLELLTLINRGQNTTNEIADYFIFTPRQSNYYGEAAEYLGLITREHGVFEMTERGRDWIAASPEKQQKFAAKLVVNSW
ncbi:MAG: hypothetical protein DRI80_07855, partial [Chloroflexota bacterium]